MTSTAAGGWAAGGCTANLRSHLPLFVAFSGSQTTRWVLVANVYASLSPAHQEGRDSSNAADVITSSSNASSGHAEFLAFLKAPGKQAIKKDAARTALATVKKEALPVLQNSPDLTFSP